MPEATDKLLAALGEEGRGISEPGARPGGTRAERIGPLFPKLD